MKFSFALVPLCLLLGACTWLGEKLAPVPQTRVIVQTAAPSDADQLLAYLATARKLDAREQAAERERLRGAVQRDRNDLERMRYALLLMLAMTAAGAGAGDEAEALTQLDSVLASQASAPEGDLRILASLMQASLNERRRLREQLRELREAQARAAQARRDDPRDAEARALRAKVETLEQKLDALKSIDRSVNRRAEANAK